MEVRSLLSQAMLDMSSHRSGNPTPRRLNPVIVLTPKPHKPKELPKLVDTLSQVSILDDVEVAEASLEGVPTTISSIALTTRSRSITPPTDVAELWENANNALEELLATKSSINAHRQRAIWELGIEIHQNEPKTVESIKEARAICSHVTLDAETLCFATVKEAKVTYIWTIKEAKAICACTIWEAETAYSAVIRDAETWGTSQTKSLYRQHAKTIWDLEEQVIQEEGRSQTDFLSTCQAALHASPVELKGMLVASYHILLGQVPMSHHSPYHKGPPQQSNSPPQQLLPCQYPSSSQAQKAASFPTPCWQHASRWDHIQGSLRRAPSSKQQEVPPWNKVLKQSHSEHSARTLTWWRRLGRSISRDIPTTSLWRAPVISERYLSRWPRVLTY